MMLFKVKESYKVGLTFGLTSGAITSLGLIVGLYSGTQSFNVVISGILIIAVADSLSDAFGMHIHEESENAHTHKEIWESMIATFASKFIFSISFLVPLLIFELRTAVMVCIAWGLNIVAFLSYHMAKEQGKKPSLIIAEHILITIIVIFLTYAIGLAISSLFR